MNFEIKYKVGETVRIITTNVVGIVISIQISIADIGHSITYNVTYPNAQNEPDAKVFFECELEKIDKSKFGF